MFISSFPPLFLSAAFLAGAGEVANEAVAPVAAAGQDFYENSPQAAPPKPREGTHFSNGWVVALPNMTGFMKLDFQRQPKEAVVRCFFFKGKKKKEKESKRKK